MHALSSETGIPREVTNAHCDNQPWRASPLRFSELEKPKWQKFLINETGNEEKLNLRLMPNTWNTALHSENVSSIMGFVTATDVCGGCVIRTSSTVNFSAMEVKPCHSKQPHLLTSTEMNAPLKTAWLISQNWLKNLSVMRMNITPAEPAWGTHAGGFADWQTPWGWGNWFRYRRKGWHQTDNHQFKAEEGQRDSHSGISRLVLAEYFFADSD